MTSKKSPEKTDANGKLSNGIEKVKENAAQVPGALAAGGKEYVNGIVAMGRFWGAYRRELFSDTSKHFRATVEAKSLNEVASLQTAWIQHRMTIHLDQTKEAAALTRAKADAVIAPFKAITAEDKAA